MANYYENARYFSSQKDLLISQLQSEIFELRAKGANYNKLRDNMIELEQSYRRLLEDKGMFEDNLRGKISSGYQETQQLQFEVEQLRREITMRSKQNGDLTSEVQRQRKISEARDEEIFNLEQAVQDRHEDQLQLKAALEDVVFEISQLRGERNMAMQAIQNQQSETRATTDHLQMLQLKQDDLQFQIKSQQEKIQNLDRHLADKENDMSRKNDTLYSTNAELQRVKDLSDELRRREASLQAGNNDKEGQNKDQEKQILIESNKLTQLRLDADTIELEVAKFEKQLDIQKKDNEQLHHQISHQGDKNKVVREELAALQRHASLLDDQNRALTNELEKFAQTDEYIKNTLDRKNRVNEMKEHMSRELKQSTHKIFRSPQRN